MSTVERVMQFVSAHLYRAETRSAVAEAAWAAVSSGDTNLSADSDDAVVELVRGARTRALAIITEGKHPSSITDSALSTLDHAIYAALAEARVDLGSFPALTAAAEAMRREHRP